MTLGFNYGAPNTVCNPQQVANLVQFSGGSVDSIPGWPTVSVGQVTQSGTTVTGIGTSFTAANVGNIIYWPDGTTGTITVFGSSTSLTVSNTQTQSIPQSFALSSGAVPVTSPLVLTTAEGGIVVPRVTTTQKNAIVAPINGMLVYDLTLGALSVYMQGAWETLETGAGNLVIPVGTAAAPGLSYVGNSNTGLWQSAANLIDFSVHGTNSLELFGSATDVNFLQMGGSATGVAPNIIAGGFNGTADQNVSLALTASGSGNVIINATSAATGGTPLNGALQLLTTGGNYTKVSTGGSNNANYEEFYVCVTLQAADILAMYGAPVLILGDIAGSTLLVTSAWFDYQYGGTAFTGGDVNILQYGNAVHGTGTNALSNTLPALTDTASYAYSITPVNGTKLSGIGGLGLYMSNRTAAYTPAVGNGSLTVYLKVIFIPQTE